jgi:hypothetical protein
MLHIISEAVLNSLVLAKQMTRTQVTKESKLSKSDYMYIKKNLGKLLSLSQEKKHSMQIQSGQIMFRVERIGYSVEFLFQEDDNLTGLPILFATLESFQPFQTLFSDEILQKEFGNLVNDLLPQAATKPDQSLGFITAKTKEAGLLHY